MATPEKFRDVTALLDVSSLHLRMPTDCASANVIADLQHIEYPGIFGTGFFARRNRSVYYFTANHCVRAASDSTNAAFATLLVPYRHTGLTQAPDDFIQVEVAFTVDQYVDHELQGTIDLIAYPVLTPPRRADLKHLLGRAARLPSSGQWLDDYVGSAAGRGAIKAGVLSAFLIGFPKESPRNAIDYSEGGEDARILTEAVVVEGTIGQSRLDGYLCIEVNDCPFGFSGFSGAPVSARVRSPSGPRFALIGMVVCGAATFLNFLPVGRLVDAISNDD